MTCEPSKTPVLALVRELLFSSRIATIARQVGADVQIIRDPAQLGTRPGRLLLVDLNQPGAIEAAAHWHAATSAKVVGFVSHVDTPTIAKAREMGIDQVMARSGFVQALPGLLAQ